MCPDVCDSTVSNLELFAGHWKLCLGKILLNKNALHQGKVQANSGITVSAQSSNPALAFSELACFRHLDRGEQVK